MRAVHQILGPPFETHMWPVMTLTLLLQLTDEEQLYAQQQPAVQAEVKEQAAQAPPVETVPAAEWPEETQVNG